MWRRNCAKSQFSKDEKVQGCPTIYIIRRRSVYHKYMVQRRRCVALRDTPMYNFIVIRYSMLSFIHYLLVFK